MGKVLVIEGDDKWKRILSRALSEDHQHCVWPNGGGGILEKLRKEVFDVIIFDLQIIKDNQFGLLEQVSKAAPLTPIVVTSETEKAEFVVKAMKTGAFDFIAKPYSPEKIKLTISHALEQRNLKNEIDYLRRQQDCVYDFDRIIASSEAMKRVVALLRRLAASSSTILMTGETGTGKSFLSGTLHFNSERRKRPFIKINCANIPESLLESELFGHEKGSFTGAAKTRVGRFEQANGGTIFLDEIGEMSMPLQAKLLRVLEERAFERLGGNQTIHADVRVIAATNRVLEDLISDGRFREDLYYRINVANVHLPPLRQRRECIEQIAFHMLEKSCRSLRKSIVGFAPEVIDLFTRYSWPGNIRQLSNVVETAVLMEDGRVIQKGSVSLPDPQPVFAPAVQHVPASYPTFQNGVEKGSQPVKVLDEQERKLILDALEGCLWIQKEAAQSLGITPRALNYKIKKLGIAHPRWRKNK